MSGMKCLATLRLLMTLPTRIPILSGSFSRPASTDALIVASSHSVSARSSARVRARSASSAGFGGRACRRGSARTRPTHSSCPPPTRRMGRAVTGTAHTAVMTRPSRATTSGRAYLDLLTRARRETRPADELLTLYVLERLLYRLSVSAHRDRLVLKGGMLPSEFGQRRPTRDI